MAHDNSLRFSFIECAVRSGKVPLSLRNCGQLDWFYSALLRLEAFWRTGVAYFRHSQERRTTTAPSAPRVRTARFHSPCAPATVLTRQLGSARHRVVRGKP